MPTVHGQTISPAGATGAPPQVEITLVGLNGAVRPGWAADTDQQLTLTARIQPAPDGSWSAELVGNADVYSPWGDTVYRVVEGFNDDLGRAHAYYIGVPATGGPYWVGDIRTGLVPDQPIEEINGVISVEGLTGVVDLSGLYVQQAGSTMSGPLDHDAEASTDVVLRAQVDGDAQPRLVVRASGAIELGGGASTADTTLRRSAANEWTTDDSLVVGARMAVGQTLGADAISVTTNGSISSLLAKATAVGTAARGVVAIETSGTTKRALDYRLTGDAAARLSVDGSAGSGSGTLLFGNGTTADVNLYRSAADTLTTDDTLTSGVAVHAPIVQAATVRGGTGSAGALTLSSTSHGTKGKILVGSAAVAIDEANARIGVGTTSPASPLHVQGASAAASLVAVDVSGDTQRRLLIDASGTITWGSGSGAGDTTLYRGAADLLKTDDSLAVSTRLTVGNGSLQAAQTHVEGAGANQVLLAKATAAGTATVAVLAVETPTTAKRGVDYRLTGDTVARLAVDASASSSGTLTFGDGATADTNLYRSAADTLKTDDSLHVGAAFRHLGSSLGFYNSAGGAKPTVTGSRGGNAALASLLTGLATLGLITDSTTA